MFKSLTIPLHSFEKKNIFSQIITSHCATTMQIFKRIWPQLFPAKPTLTADSLPPQTGRVVIITGATSGLGLELARILYHAGATVYIAARNETKAHNVINTITATTSPNPTTQPGELIYLPIDLADLRTIPIFVDAFLARSNRLDLLFNNAAVACLPPNPGHSPRLRTSHRHQLRSSLPPDLPPLSYFDFYSPKPIYTTQLRPCHLHLQHGRRLPRSDGRCSVLGPHFFPGPKLRP